MALMKKCVSLLQRTLTYMYEPHRTIQEKYDSLFPTKLSYPTLPHICCQKNH